MRRTTVLLYGCLMLAVTLFAQGPDLVKTDGISGSLHRAHIGEIVFLAKPVPPEQMKGSDFLKAFDLMEGRDLNIRVFMANSLTNYLHRLAPGLGAAELDRIGNYQFSFRGRGRGLYGEPQSRGRGARSQEQPDRLPRPPDQHDG